MLERVTPVEFVGQTPTGKTRPAYVVCRTQAGEEVEVVLKLSVRSERGVAGLAMEALVACLASDLGLPIPKPVIVELTPTFIDTVATVDSEWAGDAARSASVAFGSTRAPDGFTTFIVGDKVSISAQVSAAAILLLDAVAKNADRRPENPNLLVRGDELRMIDHELCFPAFLLTVGDAWENGGLEAMATPEWHVLRDALKGQTIDWSQTIASWQAISDSRIEEYAAALPNEWGAANEAIGRALARIKEARDKVESCAAEVQRIMTC